MKNCLHLAGLLMMWQKHALLPRCNSCPRLQETFYFHTSNSYQAAAAAQSITSCLYSLSYQVIRVKELHYLWQ